MKTTLLLAILLCVVVADGRQIFVSVTTGTTAASGADGTQGSPYNNVEDALAAAAASGDEIILDGGIYSGPKNQGLNPGGKAVLLLGPNSLYPSSVCPSSVLDDLSNFLASQGAVSSSSSRFERGSSSYGLDSSSLPAANAAAASSGPPERQTAKDGVSMADLIPVPTAMSMLSIPPQCVAILDGNGASPLFLFNSGEGLGTRVSGLVLASGLGTTGGSIEVRSSSPFLQNLVVYNSTAVQNAALALGHGGGIFLDESLATLVDVRVIHSRAALGGGMLMTSSTPAVSNSDILCCQADDAGGGMYLYKSAAILTSATISDNGADGLGGGVYLFESTVTMSDSLLSHNTAQLSGGGFYLYDSSLQSPSISSTLVVDNSAGGSGGGIFMQSAAPIISEVQFLHNSAAGDGGGAYVAATGSVAPTLTFCTATDNVAAGNGGGVYLGVTLFDSSAAELRSLSLSRNTAVGGSGGGFYLSGSAAATPTLFVDSEVTDNSAAVSGGGIYMFDSSLELRASTLSGNSVGGTGGGLYLEIKLSLAAPIRVVNTTVSLNTAAKDGGGVFVRSTADVVFKNVTALSNSASGSGGFARMMSSQHAQVESVTIRDCAALAGNGGGISATATEFSMLSSVAIDNRASDGGGGISADILSGTFSDVRLEANSAGTSGGGVHVRSFEPSRNAPPLLVSQSSLVATRVTATRNMADFSGGGLFATDIVLALKDSSFAFNTAAREMGGGVTWRSYRGGEAIVDRTVFTENKANHFGGGLALEASSESPAEAALTFVTFRENMVDQVDVMGNTAAVSVGGGGLYGHSLNSIRVVDSTFVLNSASASSTSVIQGGGVLLDQVESQSGLLLSHFHRCTVTGNAVLGGVFRRQGGGVAFLQVQMDVVDSLFSENMVSYSGATPLGESEGGGIYATQANVTCTNTQISRNWVRGASSAYGGGLCIGLKSHMTISASTIVENYVASSTADYEATISTLIDNGQWPGRILPAATENTRTAYNSLVLAMASLVGEYNGYGGGLYADDDTVLFVATTMFSRNDAVSGGGAFALEQIADSSFETCVLSDNHALNGGGAFVASSDVSLVDTRVTQNVGWISAGAFRLDGPSSLYLSGTQTRVTDNSAIFQGGIHALPPSRTDVTPEVFFLSNFPSFHEPYQLALVSEFPTSAAPSDTLRPLVVVQVLDFVGSLVVHDDRSLVTIMEQNRTELALLQHEVQVVGGVATFDSTTVRGVVGDRYTFQIQSTELLPVPETQELVLEQCDHGFEPVDRACAACKQGFFNFDGKACRSCVNGGICPGGVSLMIPEPDYWRSPSQRDKMYQCESGACLGADVCESTRYPDSVLCGHCLPEYGQFNNFCISCWVGPKALLPLFYLAMAALVAYFVSQRSGRNAGIVILAYFVQNVFIVVRDNGTIFAGVSRFVNSFNIELALICMVSSYHAKLLFLMTIPLQILIMVTIMYWSFKMLLKYAPLSDVLRSSLYKFSNPVYFALALFNLILLSYTPMSAQAINYFSCRKVEGEWLLNDDLSVKCFDTTWWTYFPAALFGLIVYALGIPVTIVIVMIRSKRKLATVGLHLPPVSGAAAAAAQSGQRTLRTHRQVHDVLDASHQAVPVQLPAGAPSRNTDMRNLRADHDILIRSMPNMETFMARISQEDITMSAHNESIAIAGTPFVPRRADQLLAMNVPIPHFWVALLPTIEAVFYFISQDFILRFFYWEIVWLAQRLLLIGCGTMLQGVNYRSERALALSFLTLVFLCLQLLFKPWATHRLNLLVVTTLTAHVIVSILILATVFVESSTIDVFIVIILSVTMIVFLVFFVRQMSDVLRERNLFGCGDDLPVLSNRVPLSNERSTQLDHSAPAAVIIRPGNSTIPGAPVKPLSSSMSSKTQTSSLIRPKPVFSIPLDRLAEHEQEAQYTYSSSVTYSSSSFGSLGSSSSSSSSSSSLSDNSSSRSSSTSGSILAGSSSIVLSSASSKPSKTPQSSRRSKGSDRDPVFIRSNNDSSSSLGSTLGSDASSDIHIADVLSKSDFASEKKSLLATIKL